VEVIHFLHKPIFFSEFTVSPSYLIFLFIFVDCDCEHNINDFYADPPKLRKTFDVRIQEGDTEITIDLRQDSAPFPEPSIFNWSKDGRPLLSDNIISLTYSNVTFLVVSKNISGNYTVSATNFLLDNTSQQLGSDIGSFHLDVLCK
jgi:hypothetical protein